MALVPVVIAAGVGAAAIYSWFRSGKNSSISVTQLQRLASEHQLQLFQTLERAFNQSSKESRLITEEYATILISSDVKAAMQIFQSCVNKELSSASQSHLAFRSNGFGNRTVMEMLRAYCKDYYDAMARPILDYARNWSPEEALSYELAGEKISDESLNGKSREEYIEEAKLKFRSLCDMIFEIVISTPVPEHLSHLLTWIHNQAETKFTDGKFDVVSVVLILRLVIPGLIMTSDLGQYQQRPILRAAQALQALTCGQTLSNKEKYMSFLDTFFTSNASRYESWRESILSSNIKSIEDLYTVITPRPAPSSCPALVTFVQSDTALFAVARAL